MQTLMLYTSTSGFTKKYADWIAQELDSDIFDAKKFDVSNFSNYNIIIFGGSLHAVGISGVKIIKDNLPRLADKKVIVFAVGVSPPTDDISDEVSNKNFSKEQQDHVKFFYLRGGFDYSKLDISNKILMILLKIKLSLKKKKNLSPDEKGMLAAYSHPIDCTKKENILPIISYVQSLEKSTTN